MDAVLLTTEAAMILPPILTQEPDGEIHVTGHRIGLYPLVKAFQEGWSPERIVAECPTLTVDEVRQVLAFYRENRAEADAYAAAYKAELDRQEAEWKPKPEDLKIRRWLEMIRQADIERADDPAWMRLDVVSKLKQLVPDAVPDQR
jgi:uncharacterized protein (DUF433 family)